MEETAEFFPQLWEATKSLEKEIPADRKNYYQAHFTYQVAVHMYSCRALAMVSDAVQQYSTDRDWLAFARRIAPAIDEIEKIIEEAHKAEYGNWNTMFMHVRLMDIWRTRLFLKRTIAEIEGTPYTDSYRGYMRGSFWGSAQAYMDHADGVFPYFYKATRRGLEVLENGEVRAAMLRHEQKEREANLKAALEAGPIVDAKFNSDREYAIVPDGFKTGAAEWTDRPYRATEVPSELVGGTLDQTQCTSSQSRPLSRLDDLVRHIQFARNDSSLSSEVMMRRVHRPQRRPAFRHRMPTQTEQLEAKEVETAFFMREVDS